MDSERLTMTDVQDGDPTLAELGHAVLSHDESEVRTAAAKEIQRVAKESPRQFRSRHVEQLVDALGHLSKANEKRLSYALYEISRRSSYVCQPAGTSLARAAHHHVAAGNYSIASNLAFPVGAVAAEKPNTLAGVEGLLADSLSHLAGCDAEYARHTRHSLMWALERRALADAGAVRRCFEKVDSLLRDEDHPPVLKHGARLIAHLERYISGVGTGFEPVAETALATTQERTNIAGCLALGAIGSERALDTLRAVAGEDARDGRVRTAARRALREATFPGASTVGASERLDADSPISDHVEEGEWVAVEPESFPTRTGRFRGEVTEVEQAVDDQYRVEVSNPYEGYTVTLVGTTVQTPGEGGYQDERQSGKMTFEWDEVRRLDAAVIPLLYALKGDQLSFSVDGVPHEITVTEVDHGEEQRRVVGTDEHRANEIEFRPCGQKPRMAFFRGGRGFEATDISMQSGSHESDGTEQSSDSSEETDTHDSN